MGKDLTPLNQRDEQADFGDRFVEQLRETHRELYTNPKFIRKGRDSFVGPVRNYLPQDFDTLSHEDRAIIVIGAFNMLGARGKISLKETQGTEGIKPMSWYSGSWHGAGW